MKYWRFAGIVGIIFLNIVKIQGQAVVYDSQRLEAEYHFIQGMKFFLLDDHNQAIQEFRTALVYAPNDDGIQYQLAQAYAQMGDYKTAIELSQKALNTDKENPYYYVQLATFYENTNSPNEAIKTYENLIQTVKKQEKYYEKIAELHIAAEKYSKAIEAYQQLENTQGENEYIAQRKLQTFMLANDTKNAIQEARKLVKLNADESYYQVLLAELLLEDKQVEEAKKILEMNAQSDSPDPRTNQLLAMLYEKSADKNSALAQLQKSALDTKISPEEKIQLIQTYFENEKEKQDPQVFLQIAEQILAQHPDNASANAFCGDMFLVNKQPEKALEHYINAVTIDETFLQAWFQVVRLEDNLKQYQSLATHTEQVLEIFPNQAVFWLYRGVAVSKLGDFEEAVFAFEEAQRLNFNSASLQEDINVLLAEAYLNQEEYSKATMLLEQVLAQNSQKPQALLVYAHLLIVQKKELDQALYITDELLKKDAQNTDYLYTKGWGLYQKGEYQEAKNYFEQAIAQNPSTGMVWERYGDTLFQLGEKEKALEQWQIAKTKGYTSKFIDKKINNQQLYEQ